jgi:endo-1,4-beta-D-glucanase Y
MLSGFLSVLVAAACPERGPPTTRPIDPPVNPAVGNARPFPQQQTFATLGKPRRDPSRLNDDVVEAFERWKSSYLRESSGVTPGGGFYIEMQGTGGDGNEITTSEAHGYGMIVFALMAGHDPDAKRIFDGFYNMYDQHRSTNNPANMSWVIDRSELRSLDKGSATDGDMDIAYALLLAHDQWGSSGAIDYRKAARRIAQEGIKASDMSGVSKRTLLGDWSTDPWATRASDWMPGHFAAFAGLTEDAFWDDAIGEVYGLIDTLTTEAAQQTGLMPDFIVGEHPTPAPPNFLEADTDGQYSWNACRFPLRIAVAAAHTRDPKAVAAAKKLATFIVSATRGNPAKVYGGYTLSGRFLVEEEEIAFAAPFVAASAVGGTQPAFLDAGWTHLTETDADYYGDSLKLLSMLLISGNWWAPSTTKTATP